MKQDVLIIAGGTGGHIFPALALALALQHKGYSIAWLGTKKGLESKLVPQAGMTLHTLNIKNLRGKGLLRYLSLPFRLIFAITQAFSILHKTKPQLVIAFGGYVSGPGALAAKMQGIPLIIHEQNAIPGLTNRWLSKVANRVLMGFPTSFPQLKKAIYTGNPLRADLSSFPHQTYQAHSPLHLLVIGGSLGAQAFNHIIPDALSHIPTSIRPHLWQQTGEKTFAPTLEICKKMGLEAKITPFIDDMNEAYTWADLIIARAGALTISELMQVGKPAILIPLAIAADDHQRKNAEILSHADAALLILEKDLNPTLLAEKLSFLIQNPEKLHDMAGKMASLSLPNSTEKALAACQAYLQPNKRAVL